MKFKLIPTTKRHETGIIFLDNWCLHFQYSATADITPLNYFQVKSALSILNLLNSLDV
jgi:hypothetical protein